MQAQSCSTGGRQEDDAKYQAAYTERAVEPGERQAGGEHGQAEPDKAGQDVTESGPVAALCPQFGDRPLTL
ncbi:hypothetical protein [Streptomyces swartbergensis]|uniref:hypothetical protein n=1 Tax=Streptomyces swartbergensis TaxID=487165 RepID=UPI001FC99113|nr:hypothetical protein [Streptomyces swartbergensis]